MRIVIEDRFRECVLKILPAAMQKALQSYEFYFKKKPSKTTDKKDFSEYHLGCKTAISHLLLLIKLSGWTREGTHNVEEDDLEAITQKAIEEVNAWTSKQVPDEDDDDNLA